MTTCAASWRRCRPSHAGSASSPPARCSTAPAAEAASVDGTDRLGLLALSGEEPRLVGHAEYVRSGPDRAEIAFEVADDHRGLGLATILLAHLAHAARRRGISTFTATVLATNHRMVEVFRDSGFPLSVRSGPGS